MSFTFSIRETAVLQAAKRERFPLFYYANFLSNLSFFLFIISLMLVLLSFANITAGFQTSKISSGLLALWLFFFEVSVFLKLKIKKPEINANFSDAALNPDNYNLAEFLSLPSAKMVEDSIKFCKARKIYEVDSSALFYSGLKISHDIKILMFRLGLDTGKLRADLKNYLEKTPRQSGSASWERKTISFSKSFQKVMHEALSLANQRTHKTIGEKEILVGLAKHDEFFKKVLMDSDLKEIDIENITLWLDSIEDMAELAAKSWSYENLARQGSLGKDFASGFTVMLDSFSVDWRDYFKKGIFNETIGHKKELEQLEMILGRSSLTNALIIGDPGSGRKSIVEGLAQKCYLGTTLDELKNKRAVELDMIKLLARIQDPEKLEAVLDQVFQEVLTAGNVILVIDNLQNFVSQKTPRPGTADVSGILSKYLPLPNFQFIGITDYAGLHQNIEQNPSFLSLFQKIEVSEITEPETIRILQNLALNLEYKNKVLITYPAIREIVNLTGRYFPSTPFPKKAIDVLDEAVVYLRTLKEKILLPHHIAKIISDKTEIPVGKMEFKEKEVLLNLEDLIHQRIVNQEEAVKEVAIAMRRARSGIGSKKRPMGTFLFLGPTGVGKTETSKALAQIYFGNEERMIRVDMSEFQAISDIPRLIGQTSPVEMQGLLTTPVRETPFSLILLDEIEKAHPNILNLFLQVLDEGHITDGQGRKILFTNTIIICTSNAGADMIFKEVESGQTPEKQKLLGALFEKQIFRPEFINRFDATVIFHPLTKDNLMKIAQLTLQGLAKNLKEKEIDFIITEPLKEEVVRLSYKPEFGAREMRRVVQDKVESAVAEALLSDKIKKGDKFEINPDNFEIIINSKPE